VVDYFASRFLSVPLGAKDRAAFVEFYRTRLRPEGFGAAAGSEPALRELLYLVLSTPEYQVN
jgi:hypothetical protein